MSDLRRFRALVACLRPGESLAACRGEVASWCWQAFQEAAPTDATQAVILGHPVIITPGFWDEWA